MKAGNRIENLEELLILLDDYDSLLDRLHAVRERLSLDTASHEIWKEALRARPEWKGTIALNKRLDDETLRLLAGDEDADIRETIARKNTFPPALFEEFASDSAASVRSAIAWHKKTPVEILHRLSLDPEDWVAEKARERLSERGQ